MNRIVWVLLGLFYMFGLTVFFQDAFGVSAPLALAGVVATCSLAIWLLSVLCVRFSQTSDRDRRFQLSTILLMMSYVSIYFAFFRVLVTSVERRQGQIRIESWAQIIMPIITGLIFVVFSTFILLHMGEAVMFTLNRTLRLLSKSKLRR